jgi:hemoglobin-like flavoprotein
LSEPQIKILTTVFEKKSCRPKDYQHFNYKTPQAFIAALKGLVLKRLLTVEERGRARIYRMTGLTVLAAIKGALGDELMNVGVELLKAWTQERKELASEFEQAQLEIELDDEEQD